MNSTEISESVFSERLPHDNRKFGTRFYGRDYISVRNRADKAVRNIDPYASPHVSRTFKQGDWWNVEVSWYSVD